VDLVVGVEEVEKESEWRETRVMKLKMEAVKGISEFGARSGAEPNRME
jgi:hypothetical protein